MHKRGAHTNPDRNTRCRLCRSKTEDELQACVGGNRTSHFSSPMAASFLSFNLPKPTPARPSAAAAAETAAADGLNDRFGRKGIKFSETDGGAPAVELTVRNGSSLRLTIPDAHVASYRPKVFWKDDGFEEVLYTVNSPGRVRGGVGLVINELAAEAGSPSEGSPAKGSPVAASEWTVKDADSDSIDAVQVFVAFTYLHSLTLSVSLPYGRFALLMMGVLSLRMLVSEFSPSGSMNADSYG